MLDFGLGELLLLGAVALIVLGPEKLPHAARMAGAWYGRIRRTLSTMQAEIQNEVNLAEIRQRMNSELGKIRDVQDSISHEMHALENNLEHQMRPNAAIMSQKTDWSHGIDAPLKSYANGYYFFFVPNSMYASLIPSAPHLPKSTIFKIALAAAKPIDTEHLIDAAP